MTAGRKNSGNKQDWNTPSKYVELIWELFHGHPDLDPCSNIGSIIKAKTEFMLPVDGLAENWTPYKKIFINPPFGRDKDRKTSIKDWIKKAWETSLSGSEVLMLIPVATNTSHWKEFIFGRGNICFLSDTRLKFRINGSEDNKGAPMACAMVYYGDNDEWFEEVFAKYGNWVY